MKKRLSVLVLLAVSLFFSACGSKAPFQAEEPMADAALVYVYVVGGMSGGENASHGTYNIRINGKTYLERIETGEYLALNLKPNATLLSAVKSQIIEEHIKLNLKAGDVNYLRITDNVVGGEFAFEQVSANEAREEISRTGLAGSNMENPDNMITELIGLGGDDEDSAVATNSVPALTEAQIDAIIEKKLAERRGANRGATFTEQKGSSFVPSMQNQKTNFSKESKLSKIKEAYEMKEQGILTESEFEKLKAEILAK
ncbi:MAG: hypothetical protein JXQ66_03995 [Campylobacterales bacterium]|nr:hypothetical protein [Campylobacterales bacterium]